MCSSSCRRSPSLNDGSNGSRNGHQVLCDTVASIGRDLSSILSQYGVRESAMTPASLEFAIVFAPQLFSRRWTRSAQTRRQSSPYLRYRFDAVKSYVFVTPRFT